MATRVVPFSFDISFQTIYKQKVPVLPGLPEDYVIVYNNTPLLKSRKGFKKVVVKVKRRVVDSHFTVLTR